MRCTLPAAELRAALSEASHVVPTTAPAQQAFEGVLLMVNKAVLTVIASDGETSWATRLAVSDPSDGQALLPPRALSTFLTRLDDGAEVTLEATSDLELSVSAGAGAPYTFRLISAPFPLPPRIRSEPVAVDLSHLGAAIAAIRSVVSKENPVVELSSGSFGLRLSATDNYRVARAELPEAGFGDFTAIVYLSVLERLAKADITGVHIAERSLRFVGERTTVVTRLVTIAFPPVDNVIEKAPPHSLVIPVRPVRAALDRLSAVAEPTTPLSFSIAGSQLTLHVDCDLGTGTEVVEIDDSAPVDMSVSIRLPYLGEALASLGADDAVLGWTNDTQPIFVTTAAPMAVTVVMMGMKV